MRNIKLMMTLGLALFCGACSAQKAKSGWFSLFNGKDLKDWDIKINGHQLNDNNGNTFRVQNGNLAVSYENYDEFKEQYGHIFHKRKFSAYLLVMEYRFVGEQVKGGPGWATRNSGAMIHSQSAKTMGVNQDFPISIEVQLLGGLGKGNRTTANLCTPGTNVVMNNKLITAHCINSTSKTYNGDQWVHAEVLVLGDSIVKHIVEKDTVLVYEKPQIGGGNVGGNDPALMQNGKLLSEGYIALQSESHPVEYRKVELFDLAPYMKDKRKLAQKIKELQQRK
ncbi:3-keto-disaccharide hydrolase [Chitinophaga sp. 22620]|uniref:3-keto-disaccharide hydrolase n=1 Tax=Chitinophaga sp. 22620 TaxID=3453952 RepID=UPI003F82A3DA